MCEVGNIAGFWNNTVKYRNAGKDHDQVLCLHGKEIKNDCAVGKIHGKGHFNGKDCPGRTQNGTPGGKYTTAYSGKNSRRKIKG